MSSNIVYCLWAQTGSTNNPIHFTWNSLSREKYTLCPTLCISWIIHAKITLQSITAWSRNKFRNSTICFKKGFSLLFSKTGLTIMFFCSDCTFVIDPIRIFHGSWHGFISFQFGFNIHSMRCLIYKCAARWSKFRIINIGVIFA